MLVIKIELIINIFACLTEYYNYYAGAIVATAHAVLVHALARIQYILLNH